MFPILKHLIWRLSNSLYTPVRPIPRAERTWWTVSTSGYSENKLSYQGIVDEICIHAYSLKASRDSWIFIAEQPENTLHFFDFEKMKLTTVVEDCNDFLCKIGKWIYFEQGEENTKAKVSIERPMSVELLGEDL